MCTVRLCVVVLIVLVCTIGERGRVKAQDKAAAAESQPMRVTEGPALPSGRGSHAGGVIGGRVVVVGGTAWNAQRTVKRWLDDSVVYRDGKWSPGPALPHPASEPMFASDGSALYVAGGRRSQTETNDGAYRLTENAGELRWDELPRLPMAITAGGGEILDGEFYVVSGQTKEGLTSDVWSLDVSGAKATWRKRQPLPGPGRMYPALVACGKRLYLLGGVRLPDQPGGKLDVFSDAYRYDPAADAWDKLADLSVKGYCWAAQAIDDRSILLTGRADGSMHKDVLRVSVPDMGVQKVGEMVIQCTCAPLVRVGEGEWWLVGGEPDSKKTRTERVSVIHVGAGGKAP